MATTTITLSPRTINNNFCTKKNITANSLQEFKKIKLTEINKSINDIVWLSYKLGQSNNKQIKYGNKTISKTYIHEVLKKIKENIKNIPEISTTIQTNKLTEEIKEKNKKNVELYKKEMFEKNVKGFESFFINLKKETALQGILTQENQTLFENFLKDIMRNKIQTKIKGYENQSKVFHKRYFSIFKPFVVCDEFIEFISKGNFGNTFSLLFPVDKNNIILDGKIKENKQKILEMYSVEISTNPFLSKMSVPFLLEICNPNYFLFPVLSLNYINYSFIITLLNIYIKVNKLKNKIETDLPLKKLLELKEITFYGVEKKTIPSSKENEKITRIELFKYIKNFLKNKTAKTMSETIDSKTLSIIENYIYFVSGIIFG